MSACAVFRVEPSGLLKGGHVTCASCRFLGAEKTVWEYDSDAEKASGFHPCFAIEHGNESSEIDPNVVADASKLAVVTDGSGYAAQLLVRKDFGCVLWEPKE